MESIDQIDLTERSNDMAEGEAVAHPFALSRGERLRGRGAVATLFSQGESGFVFPIKYLVHRGDDESAVTSVLFTVPKRYHKRANKRNLLRRRLKESYRLQKGLLADRGTGLHIGLIYTTKEVLDSKRIAAAVAKILAKIGQEG